MVQEERNNKTDFIPILGYHYTQECYIEQSFTQSVMNTIC